MNINKQPEFTGYYSLKANVIDLDSPHTPDIQCPKRS